MISGLEIKRLSETGSDPLFQRQRASSNGSGPFSDSYPLTERKKLRTNKLKWTNSRKLDVKR